MTVQRVASAAQAASEVYPHAPLVLVAGEVRYPFAPELTQDQMAMKLQRAYREWLPIVEPVSSPLTSAGISLPGEDARLIRFMARDRKLSVSVAPTRMVVETTSYERYADFRKVIDRALSALDEVELPIPELSRIGLRYIDEIRVDRSISRVSDWAGLISSEVLGPALVKAEGTDAEVLQGVLQFTLSDSRQVTMRYGAMKQGFSVGNAPLRRKDVSPTGSIPDGPYFLIDIDSFWTATDPIPEFSSASALITCDRLHIATRQLFEAAITDTLRNDVFRRSSRGR